jgi:hypothetical protein
VSPRPIDTSKLHKLHNNQLFFMGKPFLRIEITSHKKNWCSKEPSFFENTCDKATKLFIADRCPNL